MSAILAVETSTLTASVALLCDGQVVLARESGDNTHSETLLALVDECLKAGALALGDLGTIAIGAGPGSFTGLRIGMATVKGLCFAADVSLTPVSSLAALAFDCRTLCETGSVIAAVLDARRKEIFVGLFVWDGSELRSISDERVMPPGDLDAFLRSELTDEQRATVVLCGDGASKYEAVVGSAGRHIADASQTPTATAVAFLAQHLAPVDVLASAKPTYVRLPEAEIKFPNGNTGGTFSLASKAPASKEKLARKPGK